MAAWIGLQITWVTMLVIVQSVQIARGTTTYEAMRTHLPHGPGPSEALTAALTSGTTDTSNVYQAEAGGAAAHSHSRRIKPGGFMAQWKSLLGLDTFVATARSGLKHNSAQRQQDAYSKGALRNCTDFWCDPAPLFGRRETGLAMLDGEVINYTIAYERPRLGKYQTTPGEHSIEV